MRVWSVAKWFIIVALIIVVFLLAFFWTASYHAERSFERTQIELEKEK